MENASDPTESHIIIDEIVHHCRYSFIILSVLQYVHDRQRIHRRYYDTAQDRTGYDLSEENDPE